MRFTPVVFAGLMAVAYAADSTTSAAAPQSTLTTAEQKCIAECPASDVNCIAHCTPVPSPNEDDIKALNECLTKCDQGDGSEAQTIAFSNCSQKCVLENYYDPAVGTPNQGSSSSGGSSNGDSNGNSNGDSDSSNGDSSSSGDESGDNKDGEDKSGEDKSGDKGNSASGLAASTWGLFGLVVAALAF